MLNYRKLLPVLSFYRPLQRLAMALLVLTSLHAPGVIAADADTLQRVIDKGELRIAVSVLPPWVMKDKNDNFIGYEIDVANQLAKDMGVKPVFREYQWKQMIPALLDGEVDIIISGLSITPQRALKIAYSRPYSSSGYSVVTNLSLTRDFTSISDLNSDKVYIAAVKGTVSADLAGKIFPQAQLDLRKTTEDASSAVVNGTVHAFISPSPVPEFISIKHPDDVDLPLKDPLLTTREAFAINHGNADMINFLNAWIAAREADKWLKSTRKYWFKSLSWQRQLKGGKLETAR